VLDESGWREYRALAGILFFKSSPDRSHFKRSSRIQSDVTAMRQRMPFSSGFRY
jgi:hypothetical protein